MADNENENFWGEEEPEELSEAVQIAVGAASVCWGNMEGAGVFLSDRALVVSRALVDWVNAHYEPRGSSVAGVPVPGALELGTPIYDGLVADTAAAAVTPAPPAAARKQARKVKDAPQA